MGDIGPGSSGRGDAHKVPGYPLKRPHTTAVHLGNGGGGGGERDGNGNGYAMGVKNRGHGNRGSSNGGGRVGGGAMMMGKSNKSLVYQILIMFVLTFLVMETVMQGSILMLIRHLDLSANSPDLFVSHAIVVPSSTKDVYGYDVKFVPRIVTMDRLLLSRQRGRPSLTELRNEQRPSAVRPLRLALVCPNLLQSSHSLYFISIAKALQVLGYTLELFTMEDGDMRSIWEALEVPVTELQVDQQYSAIVDWLNYDGIIAMSLNMKCVLSSLAQEPFRAVPVIWVVFDDALGLRLEMYKSADAKGLIHDWKSSFRRADVVVFPNYELPMIYTTLDTGNFFVIPGSPLEVWESEQYMMRHSWKSLRTQAGLEPDCFVIVMVGSPVLYHGMWREHAIVIRAVARALSILEASLNKESSPVHLLVYSSGNTSSAYGEALQVMAQYLGLSNGTVQYVGAGGDMTGTLWMSDVIIYASLRDEQTFPAIVTRAMSLQRPVIAPNRTAFRQHIVDGVNGLLFPVGDHLKLSEAIIRVKLSPDTSVMASAGQSSAKNLLATNVNLGYGALLESILEFPAEVELPQSPSEVVELLNRGWCWDLIFPSYAPQVLHPKGSIHSKVEDSQVEDVGGSHLVAVLEDLWALRKSGTAVANLTYVPMALPAQIRQIDPLDGFNLAEARIREPDIEAHLIEKEELSERIEQPQSSWEDVTKFVRKAEVHIDDLRERDEGELVRSGQPLCIYEPYHGSGAWPFLHREIPLYRGISLSTAGKRPWDDDVDAQSRLPALLNGSYYRDALCEYSALFAIAKQIDHVHKNAWIGFQPWWATSRNVALSVEAEAALNGVATTGQDGDTLYFWAHLDSHTAGLAPHSPMQGPQDFWATCDAKNAGHCREAFVRAWRQMYGLPSNWTDLPPMPTDGGTWSALHCWALPTSSFVELVVFARMFVDALDFQNYEEHHDHEHCCFARSKREGKHCYCQLLEGLINVWAYHSARHMIYMDPQTGLMQEQHRLESRQGKMWLKFFRLSTLKMMDEDLAEAADDHDNPKEQWLWPMTGEVYWQGVPEREKQERSRLKLEKKRIHEEKLARLRFRKQKTIGKATRRNPKAADLPAHSSVSEVQQNLPPRGQSS
ncbi:unnamed protein product [Sphagnum jensenii]|uniref:Glycosyl transferase family 1 domain-containing protein n=1 Tax=Sphagnum jensenii TaxID=128206 RepID=A0ABP0VS23_9BRYO